MSICLLHHKIRSANPHTDLWEHRWPKMTLNRLRSEPQEWIMEKSVAHLWLCWPLYECSITQRDFHTPIQWLWGIKYVELCAEKQSVIDAWNLWVKLTAPKSLETILKSTIQKKMDKKASLNVVHDMQEHIDITKELKGEKYNKIRYRIELKLWILEQLNINLQHRLSHIFKSNGLKNISVSVTWLTKCQGPNQDPEGTYVQPNTVLK